MEYAAVSGQISDSNETIRERPINIRFPVLSMQKIWKLVFAFTMVCLLWCLVNLSILAFSWVKSYSMEVHNTPETYVADLRHNKSQIGKTLIISAIKAQPDKKVWFGHIWVIWPDAPPLANGEKEAGFYAKSKSEAAKSLIMSILSPLALFEGQKPIRGIMKNDEGLYRHWQLKIRVNEDQYARASAIDNKWRNQTNYLLRPSINGKTITCRDYVFEIADAIGLKAKRNDWAKFPPESFKELLEINNIKTNGKIPA